MSVQYKIPEYVHVSQPCRHLLSRIFVANPYKVQTIYGVAHQSTLSIPNSYAYACPSFQRISMGEIKSHPWFLKNLPRELKEEAQAVYYNRRGADHAASSASSAAAAAAFSPQSVEDIMRIVQEAQTVPKPDKPVSGYGWGTDDDDDDQQPAEEEDEEDDYDRTVREVHASVDLDMSNLQIS